MGRLYSGGASFPDTLSDAPLDDAEATEPVLRFAVFCDQDAEV